MKKFTVKRYIVEYYEVSAKDRKEAEFNANDPYRVELQKVTVVKSNEAT